MTFTPEELQEMILRMKVASSAFYRDAVWSGCHPFIEFTGLINEYIKLCQAALAQGIDFTETSIHGGGQPLPMLPHHRNYLREKLECIYGTSLAALGLEPLEWRGVDP